MAKRICLAALMLITLAAYGQRPNPVIDTLVKQLAVAKSPADRVRLLGLLSKEYVNENFAVSDSIGKKMIEEADLSRDRKLMAEALLINGERNSYLAAKKENLGKAIDFYNQALEMAKENKLNKEIARSYIALSSVYRTIPDADKAFTYINQASSYTATLRNDSLEVLTQIELGSVYGLKREKLLSLNAYLRALRLAEETKNAELQQKCYNALTSFYAGIENYDKAIDYAVKALNILEKIKNEGSPYRKPVAIITIGNLYSQKKSYDIANHYFQQSIHILDSLHYEPLKIPAYLGIVNNNLNSGRPAEALKFFNNDTKVKAFVAKFGLSQQIDYAYAYIYTDLGQYDSAKYYYAKAASFFENSSTEASKYIYYYQLGRMYKLSGDNKRAIESFLKAKETAEKVADPQRIQVVVKELDTVYMNTGDYRQSKLYNAMYYQYKDSLDKLGKEKDLVKAAADADDERQQRLEKEEQEQIKRKNNIQYTAITLGIAALFIMMVVLGMFKVSAGFIKAIGFFTFLMLFEFVFLVFKKNIHSITHGEPWKDLAFMIGLAALLVPLHHWVEHKVLHYLTSHNRLTSAGLHLKNKFFKRANEQEQ